MKFKYVGHGEDSPQNIKFMGEIDFILGGDFIEVDDKRIAGKLMGNKCFVSDVIDIEVIEIPEKVIKEPVEQKKKPAPKKKSVKKKAK